MSVGELIQALRLPDAQLQQRDVDGRLLWLLDIDAEGTRLDVAQISAFWQQLPYWAFAWAGGRLLAEYITQHPDTVAGKRVLDFGCGSALVGIAAAQAGAAEVWVADLDANALQAAQLNAAANSVSLQPVAAGQPWPEVDVLLASDVLYDIASSDDLKALMLTIPDWLLAENPQVAPDWIQLQALSRQTLSTVPAIGDFDEAVTLMVYGRL
jgi:predicted nicotinamide N-methyase